MNSQMKLAVLIFVSQVCILPLFAIPARAADEQISPYLVNAVGNTQSSQGIYLMDTLGESVVGQSSGGGDVIQSGFFNEFMLPQPTPTITPTVIRTFEGAILNERYVYAAPNPMRGGRGNLCFELAEAAEVTLEVYTPSSKLVLSKHWSSRPAGKNSWVWEHRNMANGVYLLRVEAKGMSGKKSVVIKKISIVK